ncbi:MAG: glycosyltransferase, partial [Candidatus Gastranaerophilaceae bacterium]
MKIALFCSSRNIIPPLKTGGTEQPIYYLAKELARREHDVTLFAACGSRVTGVKIREISPFAVCSQQKFLNIQERIASFYDTNAMADFFRNEADEFDVIQFNSYLFYEILPFAQFTNTPIVIRINYPHDLMYTYIKKSLLLISKKNQNIYFLPISNFIKSIMPNLPYLNPIFPGVDKREFKYSSKSGDYLLFMGRICKNKGAHIAIEIAKRIKQKLLIAGRIDQEDGNEYFKKYIKPNLGENIFFLGEVDKKEKIKLYQEARATVFPTVGTEAFGSVQIESMMCGTPVVAFDKGASREIIINGKNGFLVKN